jgi:hypothetical protein
MYLLGHPWWQNLGYTVLLPDIWPRLPSTRVFILLTDCPWAMALGTEGYLQMLIYLSSLSGRLRFT